MGENTLVINKLLLKYIITHFTQGDAWLHQNSFSQAKVFAMQSVPDRP